MLHAIQSSPAYQRALNFADLHFYQKWHSVWPHLARMPRRQMRVIDAGCGEGHWCAEIARRRPEWHVTGVDRDEAPLPLARARANAEELTNLSFTCADFDGFAPLYPSHLVLSICATHYEISDSGTERLFQRVHQWLAPGGQLIALVPRCKAETPFVGRLARPSWHDVFTRDRLAQVCAASQLTVERITPCIGRVGTIAKQLDWTRGSMPAPAGGAISLLARGMALVDAHISSQPDPSLMWLLIAHRENSQ